MRKKFTSINRSYLLLSMFIVGSIITFLLSSYFDLFEKFHKFIHTHEKYNLDEIIVVLAFWFLILYILFILRNKTIRKQNKEILKLNSDLHEQIDTKNKLYSILAHDLKNFFNVQIGFSEYMLDEFDDMTDENLKEIISIVHKTSHSSFELLENLLEWTRLDSGKLTVDTKKIDLSGTVNNVIKQMQSTALDKKIVINSDIQDNTYVYADRNMLRTIIRNLVSNAIKFSHPEGKVSISSTKLEDSIKITVSDKGVGLTSSQIEKLLDGNGQSTLGTNREQGSGLGLRICKEFVELNKGKLYVESIKGEGADFIFSLPFEQYTYN